MNKGFGAVFSLAVSLWSLIGVLSEYIIFGFLPLSLCAEQHDTKGGEGGVYVLPEGGSAHPAFPGAEQQKQ